METRVSFFIVAGYLVPGVVFGFVLTPLIISIGLETGIPQWLAVVSVPKSEAVAVTLITFSGLCLLACAFAIGIFLSDLYFKLVVSSGLIRENFDVKTFQHWAGSASLADLLASDWRLREAYVIGLTQGPDIYGYAARNRMVGAAGFAGLLAGVAYLGAKWFLASASLIAVGIALIALGISLARRYREWISAYAALFLITERQLNLAPKSAKGEE